jgi:hypothetical protein
MRPISVIHDDAKRRVGTGWTLTSRTSKWRASREIRSNVAATVASVPSSTCANQPSSWMSAPVTSSRRLLATDSIRMSSRAG